MSFDMTAHVANGYVFTQKGDEWNVVSPIGRHGAGPSPEDAVLNIDAQLLKDPIFGCRELHRADGTVIEIDQKPAADASAVSAEG